VSTGFQIRSGFSITEFWAASLRYGLSREQIGLDQAIFFSNGVCDPLRAGRFLCEQLGNRTISTIGYSILYNSLNNVRLPSAGQRFSINQDLAGLPLGIKFITTRANYDFFTPLFGTGFVLNLGAEGGYVSGYGGQDVILTNRFFLGQPQFRGFNIRGVGPRVLRRPLDGTGAIVADRRQALDDSLGGKAYYLARAEIRIPLGSAGSELGLRPSIFADVGALWGLRTPSLTCQNGPTVAAPVLPGQTAPCLVTDGFSNGFVEQFLGNTPKPRVSVGIGVNWNSPFGPFRFDLAKALVQQPGDDPQLFQFNVGTAF
jgi:outer membrane protein insertion porin family